MIRVLAVGKKHEAWVGPGIERYEKRLRKPWEVRWELLPHSSLEGARARQEESERLLSRLKPEDHVILLDEAGQLLDSLTSSRHLEGLMADGKSITIVIGGAYGVNIELRDRADMTWSLSPLVFPHQLVRLMLIEQIYRASQISQGSAYHHE